MDYKLADLIDIEKTRILLESFSSAVGVSAAIIDLDGRVLVASPWRRICGDFHRVNPTTRKRCIESHTILANELMQGENFSLYRCLNGLIVGASPIVIEGEHLANAFIGQFLTEKPDQDFFSGQADEHGFYKSAYLQALSEVPVVAQDALPPIFSFLTSFAAMMASQGLGQLRQLETEKELRKARLKLEVQNEELQASQADLNRAQAVANTGSWRLDVRRNVLNWSDETYRIFCIPRGDPLTYEAFLAKVHPDDQEMVDQSWQAALCGSRYDIEHRILLGDTTKWVHEQAELEFDDQGVLHGGFGTVQDITRHKEMEEALRESEERFRVMANSIPQLAWIAKADGYIYWYNQRWYEYTGTTPEQMEGWGWQSVHDQDALPAVLERWKESIATGKPFDMVFPLRGVDRNFRQFLTRVQPVKNADGDVIQWCGTNTDITERKQMEDELRKSRDELELRVRERTVELRHYMSRLEESNQALEDFASIAAHDMKEPLRKVISFGNMLRQKYKDLLGQTGNDYLNRMLDATQRMKSLLVGLLEYSRLSTKADPFVEVDLINIIGEVLSDLGDKDREDRRRSEG